MDADHKVNKKTRGGGDKGGVVDHSHNRSDHLEGFKDINERDDAIEGIKEIEKKPLVENQEEEKELIQNILELRGSEEIGGNDREILEKGGEQMENGGDEIGNGGEQIENGGQQRGEGQEGNGEEIFKYAEDKGDLTEHNLKIRGGQHVEILGDPENAARHNENAEENAEELSQEVREQHEKHSDFQKRQANQEELLRVSASKDKNEREGLFEENKSNKNDLILTGALESKKLNESMPIIQGKREDIKLDSIHEGSGLLESRQISKTVTTEGSETRQQTIKSKSEAKPQAEPEKSGDSKPGKEQKDEPSSRNGIEQEKKGEKPGQAENPEKANGGKSLEISSIFERPSYPRNEILMEFLGGSKFWFCSYFKKIIFFTILYVISFSQTQKKHFITECFAQNPSPLAPKTILLHTCIKCFSEKNYVSQNSLENIGYFDYEELKKDKLLGIIFLVLLFFSFLAVIRAFSYTKIMSNLLTFGIRVNLAACPKMIVFLKSNSFIILLWLAYFSLYIYDYCYYEPERLIDTCEDFGTIIIKFNDYTNFLLLTAGIVITVSAGSLFFYTIYKFYYDYISVHFTNIYELMKKDKKKILKALHEIDKEVSLSQFDEVFSHLVKKGRTQIFGGILYFVYCSRDVETEDVVRLLYERQYINLTPSN